MGDGKRNLEEVQTKDGIWSVFWEMWMALVVVAFFVIRILGSGTARTLLSRWTAH